MIIILYFIFSSKALPQEGVVESLVLDSLVIYLLKILFLERKHHPLHFFNTIKRVAEWNLYGFELLQFQNLEHSTPKYFRRVFNVSCRA